MGSLYLGKLNMLVLGWGTALVQLTYFPAGSLGWELLLPCKKVCGKYTKYRTLRKKEKKKSPCCFLADDWWGLLSMYGIRMERKLEETPGCKKCFKGEKWTKNNSRRYFSSVLVKAPLDPPNPPPSKLYKKLGILGQQIFCTVLRGVGPPRQKCTKL